MGQWAINVWWKSFGKMHGALDRTERIRIANFRRRKRIQTIVWAEQAKILIKNWTYLECHKHANLSIGVCIKWNKIKAESVNWKTLYDNLRTWIEITEQNCYIKIIIRHYEKCNWRYQVSESFRSERSH
jgi:hypothetical protein